MAGSSGGKGGGMAMAPQGNFNVNQAAAGGLQQAMLGTQQAMGYQPQVGQIAGSDLSAYTNPYETQVVDQSLADLERSRLMQQNQLGAQASAAGAFGGSRQGIAEAETNRAFADQASRTASGLRQSGYQNAQQLAGQDIGRQMQADQFGVQQRLGAASQMGQLGQQAFNTGQTINQNQMQQGLMQQGMQQALIDAARGQYAGFTGAPQQSLSLPLAALGAQPNQSTTTQQKNPGLFDYLSLAASTYAGMKSDVRLKTNIKHLGKENGHNVYSWDWNEDGKRIADPKQPTVGVMAQELQETHPHLVEFGSDGFLRVNYGGLAAEVA
tara:strand:- start:3501 stop:4475 length:975 start_codon:yes stop_codon:yes gene_type:complete